MAYQPGRITSPQDRDRTYSSTRSDRYADLRNRYNDDEGQNGHNESRQRTVQNMTSTSRRNLAESTGSSAHQRQQTEAGHLSNNDDELSHGFSVHDPPKPAPRKTSREISDDNNAPASPRVTNDQLRATPRGEQRSDRIQTSIPVTINPSSGSSRSVVIDINITMNPGGRLPSQSSYTTNNQASSVVRAVRPITTLDNVHQIDIDLVLPKSTAQISSDGTERNPRSHHE